VFERIYLFLFGCGVCFLFIFLYTPFRMLTSLFNWLILFPLLGRFYIFSLPLSKLVYSFLSVLYKYIVRSHYFCLFLEWIVFVVLLFLFCFGYFCSYFCFSFFFFIFDFIFVFFFLSSKKKNYFEYKKNYFEYLNKLINGCTRSLSFFFLILTSFSFL
jgi:sensor histidine kinase YesM